MLMKIGQNENFTTPPSQQLVSLSLNGVESTTLPTPSFQLPFIYITLLISIFCSFTNSLYQKMFLNHSAPWLSIIIQAILQFNVYLNCIIIILTVCDTVTHT